MPRLAPYPSMPSATFVGAFDLSCNNENTDDDHRFDDEEEPTLQIVEAHEDQRLNESVTNISLIQDRF